MKLIMLAEDGVTVKSPSELQNFYESKEAFRLNPSHVYGDREGVVEELKFEVNTQTEDEQFWFFTVNVRAPDGICFMFYFELEKAFIAALEQWFLGLASQVKP